MYPYEFDEIRAVIDKTDTMHGLVAEMECREMTEEEWLTQFHQAAVMYVEIQYALLSLDINVKVI